LDWLPAIVYSGGSILSILFSMESCDSTHLLLQRDLLASVFFIDLL
jgi:hypothetical protein